MVGRCLFGWVLAAILIGACGLPSPSTLPTPQECPGENVPDVLTFCGSSVQPPFQGYEIYYTIRQANEGAPERPLHHSDLREGFGRLSAADDSCDNDDRPPLVRATDAEPNHTIFLDMTVFRLSHTADTEPFLRLSWRAGDVSVSRGVVGEFECKRFSAVGGYEPGDIDISQAAVAAIRETAGVIYLYAYAVSYGYDRGRLYSAPLAIGRVELALPFQ